MSTWPLSCVLVRLLWLRALCGVAEGASTTLTDASEACVACVAAVLCDPQRRLCILRGRDGAPRSLGSVLGSFVTRFLGGFRGQPTRRISLPESVRSNGVAVTRDGTALLVTCKRSHSIHIICVATGGLVSTIGGCGDAPLQFREPCQVCISSDDFVFVADSKNDRIQVLLPSFEFHSFVGIGDIMTPAGVCADAEIIAVSEVQAHRVSLFSRRDNTLLRRFGSKGTGVGHLREPRGLCFAGRNIAVTNHLNDCISVFSIGGELVRTVGVGKLTRPFSVAYSAADDAFVVSSSGYKYAILSRDDYMLVYALDIYVVVIGASGEMLHTIRGSLFGDSTSVAIHGSSIIATNAGEMMPKCYVFT